MGGRCVGRGIKLDDIRANGADQCRRNNVAVLCDAGCYRPLTPRIGSTCSRGDGKPGRDVANERTCGRGGWRDMVGEWVVELRSTRGLGEIIVAVGIGRCHSRRWHEAVERNSTALHFRLPIGKEERLILLNRTSQRTAKLIQVELLVWRLISKIVGLGVELGVAEELKQRAVPLIRA